MRGFSLLAWKFYVETKASGYVGEKAVFCHSEIVLALRAHVSFPAAGNAFCQAAKLHMQLQSKHDSATCFVDAGNAYKKADPQGKIYGALHSYLD